MSKHKPQVLEGHSVRTAQPTPPGLGDYLRVLLRYRKMIFVLVVVSMAMAAVYVYARAPEYSSYLMLQIKPQSPQYAAVKGVKRPADEETFYQTQYTIIQSRAVAERVVDQLTPAQAAELLHSATWFPGLHPEPEKVDVSEHRGALISVIRGNLSVHGLPDSQLVKLSYTAPTPELAATVTNLVAHAYIQFQHHAQVQETRETYQWLTDQLARLRKDLAQAQARLQRYKQKHNLLGTGTINKLSQQKLSDISQKLMAARVELMKARARWQQVQHAKKRGGIQALIPVLNNPTIQQLKLRQSQARRKLEQLLTHYGTEAPKVEKARARLQTITQQLQAEVANVVASIKNRYQAAKERVQQLKQANQSLRKELRNRTSEEFKLAKLERQVAINRKLLQNFLGWVKEISLASRLNTTNIRLIHKAVPAGVPVIPNARRAMGLALILSVFLGAALAFVRENLNRTFRTPHDLENSLELPGIGVLPKLDKRGPDDMLRQIAREPRSPFAEAMGEIRTRLQGSPEQGRPQVIMVTSALPGESKSTLSSNLASVYSQLGKTLLIDADLRKSNLRTLGNTKGLTDLVGGHADSDECFARADDSGQSNLQVLSCGTQKVNPQEFLSATDTQALFNQLRGWFDTIVVDTAPVLAVSDALILGRYVDGVVMAVKAASTPSDAVQDGVRRLHSASIPVLGLTLSQVDLTDLLRDGGYAYGHY